MYLLYAAHLEAEKENNSITYQPGVSNLTSVRFRHSATSLKDRIMTSACFSLTIHSPIKVNTGSSSKLQVMQQQIMTIKQWFYLLFSEKTDDLSRMPWIRSEMEMELQY